MKSKRVFIVVLINIVALLLFFTALTLTAAASSRTDSATGKAEPAVLAATLSVTVLNTNTTPIAATPGNIIAFFDSNESKNQNQVDYVAGHFVGARICNVGDTTATNVETVLSGGDIQAYDDEHSLNEFELGIGETFTKPLSSIGPGACKVAYYYILTPRFRDGDGGAPGNPAEGMTAAFTITAGADGIGSAFDTGTLQMHPAIEASPNSIILITEETQNLFTITVQFDLGNIGSASGPNNVTFNPSGWISTDVGPFQLSDIILDIPDATPPIYNTDDLLYFRGIEIQNLAGTITYTFIRQGVGATTFAPYQVVNSGSQNQKWTRSELDVALAIDLSTIGSEIRALPLGLPVAAIILLGVVTFLYLRKWLVFSKQKL